MRNKRPVGATKEACPRCGGPMPDHAGGLSRADNTTEVCSPCDSEEAHGQIDGEITAMASIAVAPRGVLPAWRRYCESNPPMGKDLMN